MRRLVALFLGFFLAGSYVEVRSQQLEYDIIWLGKIGKLHINKTADEAYSFVETNSEVKIPFYRLKWMTKATFINGKLQTSNYAQLINDKKREYTDLDQVADSVWQFVNDDGQKEFISNEHQLSVSELYFKEPINLKYVFSERFGKLMELVYKGNGHYRLLLPEQNYCDYFYEEGICKTVKTKNGSRIFKFVLQSKDSA